MKPKMKKIIFIVLISNTVVGFVKASDKEVYPNNPYHLNELHNPQVVIGVERTRNESAVKSVKTSVPVEARAPQVNRSVPVEIAAPRLAATLPVETVKAEVKIKGQTSDFNELDQSERMLENVLSKSESVEEHALFEPVDTPIVNANTLLNESNWVPEKLVNEPVQYNQNNSSVLASQNSLKGTSQEYLMVINPSNRVYVSQSDGKVYFRAFEGKLRDNLEVLLGSTTAHLPMVYQVSEQHHNPTDVWMSGDTVLDILNALLINYRDPHPIRANTYANRIVEIYYDKKNR